MRSDIDIFELLEQQKTQPPSDTSSNLVIEEGEGQAAPPAETSPYVMEMDAWGRNKGKHLTRAWSVFKKDPFPERELVAADAHASLFENNPSPHPHPADAQRAEWWKQMMESPEFKALRNQTCLDNTLSEIGAKSLYDEWWKYAESNPPPSEGQPQPGSDQEAIGDSLARIRSCAKAVQQATDTVQDAKDAGQGLGMGGAGQPLDRVKLANYFQKVREHPKLRDIMRMAGRMRALSQALQRTKVQHGRDDMVGVELGGDIARLVPSELTQLVSGIPELELLALDRLARRQALCRQYRGVERLGKGPIVVCVDESASMRGKREIAAKALALTLAWLANQQRRWVGLVGFASGSEGTREAFPPGMLNQARLMDWLVHFYGGGTTLDVPVEELPKNYWKEFLVQGMPRGKTDVIIITDAEVDCSTAMRQSYAKWSKEEQVTTYGIIIGKNNPGDLKYLCQRYWCIPNLDLDTEAVESVLSI